MYHQTYKMQYVKIIHPTEALIILNGFSNGEILVKHTPGMLLNIKFNLKQGLK